MGAMRHEGYYLQEAFFKAVSGLVARRDLTSDPDAAITDLALTEDENIPVKLFRRIGPVAITRGAFRTIQRDPGEFSVLIGQQAAKGTAIDMLNAACGLRSRPWAARRPWSTTSRRRRRPTPISPTT